MPGTEADKMPTLFSVLQKKAASFPRALPEQMKDVLEMPILSLRGSGRVSLERSGAVLPGGTRGLCHPRCEDGRPRPGCSGGLREGAERRAGGLNGYGSWSGRTPKPAPVPARLRKACKLRSGFN